jgi:hypothetical protein
MFHKNVVNSVRSVSDVVAIQPNRNVVQGNFNPARLLLVASGSGGTPQIQRSSSSLIDLVAISAHRCASFFAEAAVLVLVLALLDRLIAKGHMEIGWIAGAIAISVALLAASIATDFTAKRWLRAH